MREETRGGHWREDFPDARDEWVGHISSRLTAEGELIRDFTPVSDR
jgi:nicotinate-nucleotide pyrophosphorylase (carboxylating)